MFKPNVQRATLHPAWKEIMDGAQRAGAAASSSPQQFPVRSAFAPIQPQPPPVLGQDQAAQQLQLLHYLAQLNQLQQLSQLGALGQLGNLNLAQLVQSLPAALGLQQQQPATAAAAAAAAAAGAAGAAGPRARWSQLQASWLRSCSPTTCCSQQFVSRTLELCPPPRCRAAPRALPLPTRPPLHVRPNLVKAHARYLQLQS